MRLTPLAGLIEGFSWKNIQFQTVSPASRSRLPTDGIRIIHEDVCMYDATVCCHRSWRRRRLRSSLLAFVFCFVSRLLCLPFYISFQLTKKAPSFKRKPWQDVLIHLFPAMLPTIPFTLSESGSPPPRSSALDRIRGRDHRPTESMRAWGAGRGDDGQLSGSVALPCARSPGFHPRHQRKKEYRIIKHLGLFPSNSFFFFFFELSFFWQSRFPHKKRLLFSGVFPATHWVW